MKEFFKLDEEVEVSNDGFETYARAYFVCDASESKHHLPAMFPFYAIRKDGSFDSFKAVRKLQLIVKLGNTDWPVDRATHDNYNDAVIKVMKFVKEFKKINYP